MGRGSASRPVLPLTPDTSKSSFLAGWTLETVEINQPTWLVLKAPDETRHLVRSLEGTRSVLTHTLANANRDNASCVVTPGASTCTCKTADVHLDIANAAVAYGLKTRPLQVTKVEGAGRGMLDVNVGRDDYTFVISSMSAAISVEMFGTSLVESDHVGSGGEWVYDTAYITVTKEAEIGGCSCNFEGCLHLDLIAALHTSFPYEIGTLIKNSTSNKYDDYDGYDRDIDYEDVIDEYDDGATKTDDEDDEEEDANSNLPKQLPMRVK